MIIIETLIMSLFMLGMTIWEFKKQKETLKPLEGEQMVYAAVADSSVNLDDMVLKRMDEEFRKKFDGQTLDEFMDKLRQERELEAMAYKTPNRYKRGSSMTDLHRELEPDDRRVNTDPLDEKQKKKYDKWVNPFAREEFFDNCYFEEGTLPKKTVDPSLQRTKITQNKDKVLTGDEYDRDLENRMSALYGGQHDMRGKQFTKLGNLDEEDL